MCQDEVDESNLKSNKSSSIGDKKQSSSLIESSDADAAGKLLYEKLNSIFEQDENIVELGLMLSKQEAPTTLEELQIILDQQPCSSSSGGGALEPARHVQTNIPFLYKDHRIGLSFWCLPLLYRYAYSQLIQENKKNQSSSQLVFSKKDCEEEEKSLLNITRAILLINADCFTAWSRRKEILLINKSSDHCDREAIRKELKFLNLVATKHPKSCDSWEHRSWIIKNLIFNNNNSSGSGNNNCFFSNGDEFLEFFNSEIENCEKTVTIYPRNYYSWSYRQQLVNMLMSSSSSDFLPSKKEQKTIRVHLLKSKLEDLFNWLKRNVSDHSCVNHIVILMKFYKQALLDLGNNNEIPYFLIYSLKLFYYSQYLIVFFPGHESLWVLRRFLWIYLIDNSDLFEKYFTDETLGEIMNQLIEIAMEQFNHSSIDIYPYEPIQLASELLLIQRCINDKDIMIGSTSQIRHSLTNTLHVVKHMQKFSEKHSYEGLIVRNFISGDLQLEDQDGDNNNNTPNNVNKEKVSQSIQRCLSNITTIIKESFGHAGVQ